MKLHGCNETVFLILEHSVSGMGVVVVGGGGGVQQEKHVKKHEILALLEEIRFGKPDWQKDFLKL